MKKRFESLFFIRVQLFFFDNSFFSFFLFFEMLQLQAPQLFSMEKKCTLLCIYTHETGTDVDTKKIPSHTSFRFHISCTQKKKPAFFAKQNLFFLLNFAKLQLWWFSYRIFFLCCFAAVSAFRYQYVCIAFNVSQHRGGRKKMLKTIYSVVCAFWQIEKESGEKNL